MAFTPSSADLYTTVKNLMGVDHVFGYLPPHGKRLRASSTYTVPGSLLDRVLGRTVGNYSRRGFKSLERDLTAGRLAILETPKQIYYDSLGAATPAPMLARESPGGPAGGGIPDPTRAPVVSAHGSGEAWGEHSGDYSVVYSYVNDRGETKPSPAAKLTLNQGHTKATVTVPPQEGATGANVYVGKAGEETFIMTVPANNLGSPADFPAKRRRRARNAGSGEAAFAGFGGEGGPGIEPRAAPPGTNTALLPAPTGAPVVVVTGGGSTGGLLVAGAYFLKYTFTNANGESIASPEAGAFTVTAGQIPSVFIPPAPTGYTGIKIYLTQPAGLTNTEIYYDTVPIPPGGYNSVLTGYLQPGVGGTGPNPLVPMSQYLLAKKVPTTGVAPPTPSTALISPPTFTPVGIVSVSGQPQRSPPLSNLAPYLAPGAQGDVAYAGLSSGGLMAVGTYRAKISYNTAAGETTVGPESDPFTITAAGQIPTLLLTPPGRSREGGGLVPPGVTLITVYLTLANGAANSEQSYVSTPPVSSLLLKWAVGAVPATVNTTGPAAYAVAINTGVLGAVDPSWGQYAGLP